MLYTKKQITVGGKVYGYWVYADGTLHTGIRSESNPHKTPYLKKGSPTWEKVFAAAKAACNA